MGRGKCPHALLIPGPFLERVAGWASIPLLCHGLPLPEAEGIRQWSARTRHPSDDQVGLGSGVTSRCGGSCPVALPHSAGLPSSPVSRVVYNGKRNSSPALPNSSEIFTPA